MEFEYCTLKYLKDEGWDGATPTEDQCRRAIRRASLDINRVTTQWFQPVASAWRLDGEGSPLLCSPQLIPIVVVSGVKYFDGSGWYAIEDDEYVVQKRWLEMVGVENVQYGAYTYQEPVGFPDGALNVEMTGVIGWLENEKYVETELAAEVKKDDVVATLDSVTGIEVNDCLLIGDSVRVNVNEIETATKKVKFDKILENVTEAIGAKVFDYGRVPLGVMRACALLVHKKAFGIFSDDYVTAVLTGRLKSEKTDNYSYSLGDGGDSESSTGVAEADRILSDFVPPLKVSFV